MILCPDTTGFWKHLESGEILDVYELEPVNNTLCIWCQDVNITYTDPSHSGGLHQTIWITDEWLGHIPVSHYVEINYPRDDFGWMKLEDEPARVLDSP